MATSYISITAFGAKGDGRTDNRAAIQKAIDTARAQGKPVYVPEGVFLHRGTLTLNGVDMIGAGSKAVLKAIGASSSDMQSLILTGTGASVSNLTLDSDATTRGYTGNSAKIQVRDATDFGIRNVTILNSMGAGMIVLRSSRGVIQNNLVRSTNADSIHMTHGSNNIQVLGNRIENAHDDGIAVVSYASYHTAVNNITIRNNTVLNNQWGRNIAVVGGQNVTIEKNYVQGNQAERAGIYIASEWSYVTWGVKNVLVQDNHVRDTGGYKSGQGGVMVYSSTKYPVEDVVFRRNEIVDSNKFGVFLRGQPMDDITFDRNLITGSGDRHFYVDGKVTDLVQTGTTHSWTGWTKLTGLGAPSAVGAGATTTTTTGTSTATDTAIIAPTSPTGGETTSGETVDVAPKPTPAAGNTVISLFANATNYKGDAQFNLLIDGQKVGSTATVTQDRGTGWQRIDFAVNLTKAPSSLGVQFVNDLYEGVGKDRNLYVDKILVNGKLLTDTDINLFSNGTRTVDTSASQGLFNILGPEVKVFAASTSYNGDAQFRLLMDGVQIGTHQTVSVQRGTGWQEFRFNLPAGARPNTLAVQFTNDLYGGVGKDRNLYVDRIELAGTALDAPGAGGLFTQNASHSFNVGPLLA